MPYYCKLKGLPPHEKPTLVYRHPRGYDATLYGAKIVENISQGTCRDFVAESLVELESEVLSPVMHVHDEIVCEVPRALVEESLHDQCKIMSTQPSWAPDFPLRVEGYTNRNYVKSPWSDSYKAEYMGGRRIA